MCLPLPALLRGTPCSRLRLRLLLARPLVLLVAVRGLNLGSSHVRRRLMRLGSALVAMVGGTRPVVSTDQVVQHLLHGYQVPAEAVQVHRYKAESFLLIFNDRAEADRVLHAPHHLTLVFRRWQRQHGAQFSPLYFKLLLAIENVPAHVWSLEVAHQIVGSSCLIFDVAPCSISATDMSQFMAATWTLHPDLIPSEVGCVVPEPEEPSEVGQPPLFLGASEIIHDKQNTLQFRASVEVIEIHDYSPHSDSSDDGSSDDSDDSGGDGIPGATHSYSLRPWTGLLVHRRRQARHGRRSLSMAWSAALGQQLLRPNPHSGAKRSQPQGGRPRRPCTYM
jgi:hypothetical protein